MNQATKGDILFVTRGTPIVELRDLGDKLALFTEDPKVLGRFRHWEQLLYLVPYTRGDKLVGADLYFAKESKRQLLAALTK